MRRADFLVAAGAAVAFPAAAAAASARPRLHDLRVRTDGPAYAGDRRLLATVSPKRPRAIVSFRLDEPARVLLQAVRTDTIRVGRPSEEVVWARETQLGAGSHELSWTPGKRVEPRTYILRLTAYGPRGARNVFGAHRPGGLVTGPVVRVLGVEAGFPRTSYAPGEETEVRIATDARTLELQVFRYGGSVRPSSRDLRTNGLAMTPAVKLDWRGHQDAPATLKVQRAGKWPSGLYFLRVRTDDGRVGYAPFILRPKRLGVARTAVVLATNTWQAYNFHDSDGDGWGDSWYVANSIKSLDATRPYQDFGVPFRFKDWDLTFIAWLNRTQKQVDFLADDDIERVTSGAELRRAYDLIVFPGHEEYVTKRAYDVVERYRDLGGNLMFLAANNFFWKVRREGSRLVKDDLWRDVGRPEASLVGTHYVGSDHGERRAPYTVVGSADAPWLFEGTGLTDGSTFGEYGIEIDSTAASSPAGTRVLASIPDLMGPGRSAEMTYYETPAGAEVFSAGAIDFAASLHRPEVNRMLENLWLKLGPVS